VKLLKVLDQEGENLVADPTNQIILRELVTAPHSISELAAQLKLPTLNVWRRMQKLKKVNIVEVTEIKKVGNLEKKLYRSTATLFTPQQYFNFSAKDKNLKQAFEIYSDIQKSMMTKTLTFGDVPKDADPIDYSLYVNMQVFAEICGRPETHTKIAKLEEALAKFRQPRSYL